ncbi:MAG: MmgE/PrpD family protein [SAR324 cluster bacterium]|nr:MmgE/PrpD family protein [SAR324 cluster bacterium]MCZ6841464.1 MmgE/PrpD family protein [SAR324 cluster bacterium]
MTAAESLGRFAAELRWETLDSAVKAKIKLHVLDTVGVMSAGAESEEVQAVRAVAQARGGVGEATTVGWAIRLPAPDSAFLNAFQGRIYTLDDTYEPGPMHPGSVVIAAAMACSEAAGTSGRRFLEAVAAGYEVAVRIAHAVHPAHYAAGFHPTGTCAVFGAGAAAARALGLSPKATAITLGLAGEMSAGLRQYQEDGSMADSALNGARAAEAGVIAARLAAEGFEAPRAILEGRWGFFQVMAQAADVQSVTEKLGRQYRFLATSLKPYAGCRFTHGPVEVALTLRAEANIDPGDIESVEIATFQQSVEVSNRPEPETSSEAILSHQYAVALAMLYGRVTLEEYLEPVISQVELRQLYARVRVVHDPSLDSHYPDQWPHRVTIRLRGGREISGESHFPPGGPEAPLPEEEVVAKFRGLAGKYLGVDPADRISNAVFELESLADMRDFTRQLELREVAA